MNYKDTTMLMRVIGLPHNDALKGADFPNSNSDEGALLNLLPLAIKNKVPLLFLENAMLSCRNSNHLTFLHQTYLKKWKLALELVKDVSRTLSDCDVNYAIFKTLEPYPFVRSDIDILFFANEDIEKSYNFLRSQGYKFLGSGPYSITLHSVKHEMNIDLQLEISVSRLIYLDKSAIRKHVTKIEIDDCTVPVLEPPASLITMVSHSFYKEQILTLSNYYTAVMEILAMNEPQRRTVRVLAEELNANLCTKLVLELIQALTVIAFRKNIQSISEITGSISISSMEEKARQISLDDFKKHTELPYKYQPVSIALAFITKTFKDPLMRHTINAQLLGSITNVPTFMLSMLRHIKRDTY